MKGVSKLDGRAAVRSLPQVETLIISLSSGAYARLCRRAAVLGVPPERLSEEMLEAALTQDSTGPPQTTHEILAATNQIRPLSPSLRASIVRDIPLEEVRAGLSSPVGLSLIETLLEQRGPKG
jgi:hypothetical protein